MAENSKIEWTTHTFNPWEGCTKVSPGCTHCYAEARNNRFISRKDRAKGVGGNWGKGKPRRRTSAQNWKKPLKWNREAEGIDGRNALRSAIGMEESNPHRPRVFCASLDWLDDEVPIEWLADLLKLIHDTPNLDWLLLTKRPENWRDRLCLAMQLIDREWLAGVAEDRSAVANWIGGWIETTERGMQQIPHNVWIGASVEDQPRSDERIPELAKIPAKVRFLSVEPMLGPIDFERGFSICDTNGEPSGPRCKPDGSHGIDWVIFGGESGPGARPCNIEWIRDGVRQCRSAGVAPFVKQLGSHAIGKYIPSSPTSIERNLNKAGMLRDKKGGDITEWAEDLRVREFPV
jgi:protein gp37